MNGITFTAVLSQLSGKFRNVSGKPGPIKVDTFLHFPYSIGISCGVLNTFNPVTHTCQHITGAHLISYSLMNTFGNPADKQSRLFWKHLLKIPV